MRALLLALFIFMSSHSALAKADGFSAYAALGENLRPFSFRVGYNDWEFGMLNGYFGFDKVFHLNESYYSAFGFAVSSTSPGVYGGIGWKTSLWFIPIRCELAAIMDVKGLTQSGALIGVTYGF